MSETTTVEALETMVQRFINQEARAGRKAKEIAVNDEILKRNKAKIGDVVLGVKLVAPKN